MKLFTNGLPEKPKKQKDQVDTIWDFMTNHLWTRLSWIDMKVNFMFALLGVIIALLAVVVLQ